MLKTLRNCLLPAGSLTAVLMGLLILTTSVEAKPAVDKITAVEGISEYRLKNGLTVLLFPDPSKETVTVNMTYKVGSKHENYGETGMAHLLEHLMFKGTKKHPDIPAELSAHGAKPNGTTWVDRTNYYETFAATDDNIDWALGLEADRMVNSFIAKDDLDSEMTVVRNEFERTENSPVRVLMQRMMATAFVWHNNGKPTIGARSDIENVSIERLQAFYQRYYQPDNAVLTVAGKFDEQAMLKRVTKFFGKLRAPKRTLPTLYTTEPAQDGENNVVVRRVGDIQWYASAYHIPAGSHPDYAALEVLVQIMGDTPRGRLHKELVEQKLAVATFAFPFELQDPGVLFMAAQVEKDADIEKTRKAFLNIAEGAAAEPFTEQEVERAKSNLHKGYELAFNSSERIAILLSEYIGMGDWRLLFLTRDRIQAVTTADVQRVAQAYLRRNNRTEGQFIPSETPDRVDIPIDTDIAAMLEGYTGREAIAQGEAFDPSFDNIAARTQVHSFGKGFDVALLPKKTRGESVVLQLSMQFGELATLRNQAITGELVGSMLLRGTDKLSREALQDRFDALKARVEVNGSVEGAVATIETNKENLAAVIVLLAEILQQPAFDGKEFEQLKTTIIAGLEASRQEPQSIVSREMGRFYNPYEASHPYYQASVDEEIAALKKAKVDQLRPFHKRFYGSDHMQIAVVGDFDETGILQALQQHFAKWRSGEPYESIPQPYQALTPIDKTVDTPDKENAAIVAMLPIPVGNNDQDAVALEVGTYIYGGGFLNSRLATRLRQKDGLSYGTGAWVDMSDEESRGRFGAYAIYAPQNIAAVEAGIKEELKRLLQSGITDEELSEAKSGMLQNARMSRTENSTLAGFWVANLYLDRSEQWHKAREQKLENMTKEQVLVALKKHIDPSLLSFVKAADLEKVAAGGGGVKASD